LATRLSIATFRVCDTRISEPTSPTKVETLNSENVLRSWTEAHATSLSVELDSPLDARGMDPTWMLRMSGQLLEAEVHLFYGPHVDVSAFLPQRPEVGMFVGGEDGITGQRLVEMLDGLEKATRGGAMPTWLHSAPR
jgi:hypothetical protein